MSISINTALRSYLLDSGSFKSAMDNSTLTIYSGTAPDVNVAATGTALAVVGSANLDFAASASSGVIAKTGTWKTADNSTVAGTAGYYRLVQGSYIVQGTVKDDGTGDLNLATVTIPGSSTITIDYYTITMPGA